VSLKPAEEQLLIRLYVVFPDTKDELGLGLTIDDAGQMAHAYFDGATIYFAHSMWKGTMEQISVVEIISSGAAARRKAHSLAEDLKVRFKQEAVMLTIQSLASVELV
jgi:hypothetical protein